MKMEIGHVINVEGKEGTVVHTAVVEGGDYVLVTFEEGNKLEFKVFEVKYENNDFFVSEETNEEFVAEMLLEFTKANTILGEED